jgi:V/A-type H+-transporting ATPase subunit E
MAIENLKKSILQEAEKEAERIVSEAEAEAEKIKASSMEKAKTILAQAKKKAEETGLQQSNDRISSAKLKAKKMMAEANEAFVENALEEIWNYFKKIPEESRYESIMKKLILNGQSSIGKNSVVFTNSKDAKIAKKYADNVSQDYVEISGGAIIKSGDGKIIVDNSLESIFQSKKNELRRLIYLELLGYGKAGKK